MVAVPAFHCLTVHAHRPVTHRARPPACADGRPPYTVRRDWDVTGHPPHLPGVHQLGQLILVTCWVLDQEPPSHCVFSLSARTDQRLEHPALYLLRTLPCPRWKPVLARVIASEKRLGVL